MPNSIDWSRVADLYDDYVKSTLDVPFFLDEARKTSGDVLELMAGTGRVSVPLIEAGVRLTCVDASADMLAVLRAKIAKKNLVASVHKTDVRELNLGKRFNLIFIPFHSFAELLTAEDQCKTLSLVREHLEDNGRFICTMHNPRVRLKRVDGQLHLWENQPLAQGCGTLLFWGHENYNLDTHIVTGFEFFEEYDGSGIMRSKRMMELHFRILEKDEFVGLAASTGFRVAALYGDYAYAEFHDDSSPFMIWMLEKA